MANNRDLYQEVTDKLIAQIESNPGTWMKPWNGSSEAAKLPVNGCTGHEYSGVNIPMLWFSAKEQGFSSNQWGTFNQWKDKGGHVKKGSKGTMIVFFKALERENSNGAVDASGNPEMVTIPLLRSWSVFNRDQIDGLPASEPAPEPKPFELMKTAEEFFTATGAVIHHGGDRAFYSPGYDRIQMPHKERFTGSETSTAGEAYYSTLAHELTHWTGDKSRCDRQFGKRFGDDAYAFEELVAEMGAAFLCAHLGIASEPRADHAQYLAHWLRVMKSDKRAIFTAASKASAAVAFLRKLTEAKDEAALAA